MVSTEFLISTGIAITALCCSIRALMQEKKSKQNEKLSRIIYKCSLMDSERKTSRFTIYSKLASIRAFEIPLPQDKLFQKAMEELTDEFHSTDKDDFFESSINYIEELITEGRIYLGKNWEIELAKLEGEIDKRNRKYEAMNSMIDNICSNLDDVRLSSQHLQGAQVPDENTSEHSPSSSNPRES